MHFRHLMLFHWQGKTATQTTNKIYTVYRASALVGKTVHKWFAKFKVSDIDFRSRTVG